jgi:signal transduction histidine kinase/DNA-binding response OmpR family regulator
MYYYYLTFLSSLIIIHYVHETPIISYFTKVVIYISCIITFIFFALSLLKTKEVPFRLIQLLLHVFACLLTISPALHILPSNQLVSLGKYGTALQGIFFSFSMARHIKLIIQDKHKAEKANQDKSTFLANMSHDIRTPMNAVIGFSDLLAGMRMNEQQQSYVRAIRSGGKNLLALINNILDLSRIEAQKLEIHPEPVRIRNLLREIQQVFALKITEKQLSLDIIVDEKVPDSLMLDNTQLRRILFNLVGNAVKFTRKGYIRIILKKEQIIEQGAQEKINLIITVEDTGPGIPATLHESIFDPFQQDSSNPEHSNGTGLGLAITRQLAEVMNGKISLHNRVGGGCIFTVRLDDVLISKYSATGYHSPEQSSRKIIFRNLTILIADDLEEHRDLLQGFFIDMPVQIIEAKTGPEAAEQSQQYQPDIILMDIRMPGGDGCTAAQKIKTHPVTNRIPIIAITAFALDQEREKIMATGSFDAVLTKPIQQKELFRELAHFVPFTETDEIYREEEEVPGTVISEENTLKTEDLSRLIEQLEKEISLQWQQVCQNKVFSEIEQFAEKIRVLGTKHDSQPLIVYGKTLKIHSSHFAIEKMKAVLYAFPDLIEQLKARQQLVEKIEKKEEQKKNTHEKNTHTDR